MIEDNTILLARILNYSITIIVIIASIWLLLSYPLLFAIAAIVSIIGILYCIINQIPKIFLLIFLAIIWGLYGTYLLGWWETTSIIQNSF